MKFAVLRWFMLFGTLCAEGCATNQAVTEDEAEDDPDAATGGKGGSSTSGRLDARDEPSGDARDGRDARASEGGRAGMDAPDAGRTDAAWPALEPSLPVERVKAATPEVFVTSPDYVEGPVWRDGDVFFHGEGATYRATPDRKLLRYIGRAISGAYRLADNSIIGCSATALLRVMPDGKVLVLAESYAAGKPLRGCNDVTIDREGRIYFTDPSNGEGTIGRVSPNGQVERLATGLSFPNGIEVDPASERLYVMESFTKRVLRYPIPAPGERLAAPQAWKTLEDAPDGCTFDAWGNLWVAVFGAARVVVLSPQAMELASIRMPGGPVSNVAFGGERNDVLYATAKDGRGEWALIRVAVGVRGFLGHPGAPSYVALRELSLPLLNTAVMQP